MTQGLLFYLFSGLTVISALCVILHNKPTRSLLALMTTMISLAVLFVLLGAYFVAMVHLIVYAGAVLVLFLFVIMLQGVGAEEPPLATRFSGPYLITAVIAGAAFMGLLVKILAGVSFKASSGINGSPEAVGYALFEKYLLPFELTSILLLLGIFAAIALAKKEKSP